MANVLLTMMHKLGVNVESIGDRDGRSRDLMVWGSKDCHKSENRSLKSTFGAVCAVLCLCLPAYAAGDLRVVQAAMSGDRDGVKALLEKKADVNAPQGDGTTALHWAALNNDPQMVQLLVAAGANLNAATRVGSLTPIAMGCMKGYAPVIKVVLGRRRLGEHAASRPAWRRASCSRRRRVTRSRSSSSSTTAPTSTPRSRVTARRP